MPLTRLAHAVGAWLHKRQLLASLLVAAMVASPGYWLIEAQNSDQNTARCRSGNELRVAVRQMGQSVDKYIDDLLAGFGTTNQVDVSKLTADERKQLGEIIVKITASKKAFEDRLKDPAFRSRPC